MNILIKQQLKSKVLLFKEYYGNLKLVNCVCVKERKGKERKRILSEKGEVD